MSWIKCSERMPEPDADDVLVYINAPMWQGCRVALWDGDLWITDDDPLVYVTHWKPLPEPPGVGE